MTDFRLPDLVAAPCTPMHGDGEINYGIIPEYVDCILKLGFGAIWVNGSIAEGQSLTTQERKDVAEEWVKAIDKRVPVVVHVGANCLKDSAGMARHAQSLGVDAIAAVSPSYYKPQNEGEMVDVMADVASAAPQTPFYFYDNKKRTGIDINCSTFLELADGRIPSLRGLKHQSGLVDSVIRCLQVCGGKYQVLMGADPSYLGNLQRGNPGNMVQVYMGHFMVHLKDEFLKGNIDMAEQYQAKVTALAELTKKHGGSLGVVKCTECVMSGLDLGPVRLPLIRPSVEEAGALRRDIAGAGFTAQQ